MRRHRPFNRLWRADVLHSGAILRPIAGVHNSRAWPRLCSVSLTRQTSCQLRLMSNSFSPAAPPSMPAEGLSAEDAVTQEDAVRKARLDNMVKLIRPWLGHDSGFVRNRVREHAHRFTNVSFDIVNEGQPPRLGKLVSSDSVVIATLLGGTKRVYGLVFNDSGRWYAVVRPSVCASKALLLFGKAREKGLEVLKSVRWVPSSELYLIEFEKDFIETRDLSVTNKFFSFLELMERVPQTIGAAFKLLVERNESKIKNVAWNWKSLQHIEAFKDAFRPVPTMLLPMDLETTLVSRNQKRTPAETG